MWWWGFAVGHHGSCCQGCRERWPWADTEGRRRGLQIFLNNGDWCDYPSHAGREKNSLRQMDLIESVSCLERVACPGIESVVFWYHRLQHLLEKSNISSKFLLTEMEQHHLEEQKKKEKLEIKNGFFKRYQA